MKNELGPGDAERVWKEGGEGGNGVGGAERQRGEGKKEHFDFSQRLCGHFTESTLCRPNQSNG